MRHSQRYEAKRKLLRTSIWNATYWDYLDIVSCRPIGQNATRYNGLYYSLLRYMLRATA